MGLPQIIIKFTTAAQTAVLRSQQGIVALILRDETVTTFTTKTYSTIDDVSNTDWTADNYDLIEKTFLGTPSKIIVVRGATTDTDYTSQLNILATMRWNYLAIPGITDADAAAISTWLIDQRSNKRKTYKAVLPNSASDNEGVINFTTSNIVVGAKTYTTSQYTGRIAGILAGLPQTRSSTYYVLSEVDSITQSANPDTDIDAGKLILIDDGEKIKIARGVNSLQTLTSKTADWKKIKIIDGHDLVQDDIANTFADEYVGQVDNDYDNQSIFISAVNVYLKTLGGTVLDPNGTNTVGIDVQAQRQAWQDDGVDTSTWTDQQVKDTPYKAQVFLSGSLKFLDAMEDLQLNMTV